MEKYDVIVVGGGVLGLSAAYNCAKAGKKVLVLEEYEFFNQNGSSADFCRMWRVMYTGVYYARMALATSPLWDQLEAELGQKLIDKSGLLNFGINTPNTPEGTMEDAERVMKELKIPFTRLTSSELTQQYPFRNLPRDYYGLYQANGGTIDVQGVLRGYYKLAATKGAVLKAWQWVTGIEPSATYVDVQTVGATYRADKVILCAGAFINDLLAQWGIKVNLQIWEMTFAYYQVLDPKIAYPMWFQFEETPASGGSSLFYGFPSVPWARPGYLRIAVDFASHVSDSPAQRTYVPATQDIHLTMDYIQSHMVGVSTHPTQMATCLVPLVPDNGYVLDFAPPQVPNRDNVVVATAGWAFKFAPMFGAIMAELAIKGESTWDIEPMSVTRPGVIVDLYPGEAAARAGSLAPVS
jgi:sarcosine oxidase / L-pipecolate oxidase